MFHSFTSRPKEYVIIKTVVIKQDRKKLHVNISIQVIVPASINLYPEGLHYTAVQNLTAHR
jgi:hypothetical protein